MRTTVGRFFGIALTLAAFGCATVPKQTVTLSETIAEQTASLQTAHETLVSRYYAEMRDRVNQFMQDVWIPAFLANAVNNQAVQDRVTTTLAAANLNADAIVQKINSDNSLTPPERAAVAAAITQAKVGGRAQFGQVMLFFSQEAQRQIELQRKELMAPIDQQEQLVLQKLRESYAQLQAEQASIKGFLSSAVHVQQSQDEILKKLNLLTARDQAINNALALNDQATSVLATVNDSKKGVADFLDKVKKVNDSLRGGKENDHVQ